MNRTVSRMLAIIVAFGYGIVKPRCSPLKEKVLGIGLIYFGIATTEALLRLNTKNDQANNEVFVSRIPLAVIDAMICYWIFTGLMATTRTLRSKENVVILNIYRYFTNLITFALIASLTFMIWSLKSHFFTVCVTNWREFWVTPFSLIPINSNSSLLIQIDDAFWHILSSLILLVIMILFRPSPNVNNDQFDVEDHENDGRRIDLVDRFS